jgi:hypothetical protein
LAYLGVLGALALNVLPRINRQDAKSAKSFAKQNSFHAAKAFRHSTSFLIREIPCNSVAHTGFTVNLLQPIQE